MIDRTTKIDPLRQGLEQTPRPSADRPSKKNFQQILSESLKDNTTASAGPSALEGAPIRGLPQHCVPGPSEGDYERIINIVFGHEGKSLVKNDGDTGESSKFGILESTARQYGYKGEMGKLTRQDAEAIYKKLWEKSGAANLPYPLSLVHFDTYVNSPAAARRILEKSQGDVDAYLSLRQQRYKRLAELRPERFARYLKGWNNRIENLRALVTQELTTTARKADPLRPNSLVADLSPLKIKDSALF
jgi:lysozyme family protein